MRPANAIVGIAAEQARVQAEIQSALTVAAARPRDEIAAIDRIKTSCQRPGLAEKAEYVYSRGGTEISGPTIDLLTVISNQWGNVSYGFRELSETAESSTVEAFAWDLETNAKRAVTFTVAHKRYTKQGSYALTDPRDRYENLANLAQRRVRACLEAIIPPDVVEDAVSECRGTLQAKAEVTPDAISKLLAAFGKFSVTKDQIEVRLGRRVEAMHPAQLINLRRIYKSLTDGMSKPGDWFAQPEPEAESEPKTATEAAKDALRKKATPAPEAEPEPAKDPGELSPTLLSEAETGFRACDSLQACSKWMEELFNRGITEGERKTIGEMAGVRKDEIAASAGKGKTKQPALAGTT